MSALLQPLPNARNGRRRNHKETKHEIEVLEETSRNGYGYARIYIPHCGRQENRSEISLQGTGFFTKDTQGNGVFQRGSETGGFLIGYRYNLNRHFAAEVNNGYDRNTQFYFGGTPGRVQSNIHQITSAAVVKLPSFARLQPYALAGAGALVFDPTGHSGGGFGGATSETKGAFVYGVGAEYAFTRHFSLRAEYRGLVYKAPSFNLTRLNTDSWTHTAQPSAGIVFHF